MKIASASYKTDNRKSLVRTNTCLQIVILDYQDADVQKYVGS